MKQPGHVALKALKLFTHFTPQQKERSISPKGPTSSASHSFFQRLDGTWSQVYAAEFSAGWTMNCGAITVCHHGVVREEGTTNPVVQDLMFPQSNVSNLGSPKNPGLKPNFPT
jgi:hypothetical protein